MFYLFIFVSCQFLNKKKLFLTRVNKFQIVFLDFGMNEKNPVDEIRFYSKDDVNHAASVQAQEVN